MCFLREPWLRGVVEEACRAEGLEPLGWRDVPVDPSALGSTALATMPRIAQLVLAPCADDAERRALPRPQARGARRRRLRRVALVPHGHVQGAVRRDTARGVLSGPARPGLGRVVGDLPPALLDEHRADLGTRAAVPPALPQRRDQHDRRERRVDGGARARTRARSEPRARRSIGAAPTPLCSTTRSSCSSARGSTFGEALSRLVPPGLAERSAGRRRRAGDAPLPRDDGRAVGRARRPRLHRRRRPAGRSSTGTACGRSASPICADGLVAVASEAGAVPLPDGVQVRRGRLGPGQLLSVDPQRGLRFDGELTRELAARRPYDAWVSETIRLRRGRRAGRRRRRRTLVPRHALHGYTREELSLMLRPIAQSGRDPVYSMGDDAPIAPLAGRARPLASYFRQRFAQVTNPAIDHYRERAVMSVATLVGAKPGDRGRRTAGAARRAAFLPGHTARARRALAVTRRRDVRRRRGALRGRRASRRTRASRSWSRAPRSSASSDRRSRRRSRADSVRCSQSLQPTTGSSKAGSGSAARSSSRATRPGTATWSRPSSATARTSSAHGSRWRPSPTSRRSTRSAATGRRPKRRSGGSSTPSRTAS